MAIDVGIWLEDAPLLECCPGKPAAGTGLLVPERNGDITVDGSVPKFMISVVEALSI